MRYLLLFALIFASDVVNEIKGLNEKNWGAATRSGIKIVEFHALWQFTKIPQVEP